MDGDRDIIRDDLRHAEPADAKAAILTALPQLTNTTDIADVIDAAYEHLEGLETAAIAARKRAQERAKGKPKREG
jgi:hypothetical protein